MAVPSYASYVTSYHQPHVGGRYLWLNENGWFGRHLNKNGSVYRHEPLLFAGMSFFISDPRRLTPTLYLSRVDIAQTASGDWRERNDKKWIGKLSLAWHWRVAGENGAMISTAPSLRLHRTVFGGGNVQLYSPL